MPMSVADNQCFKPCAVTGFKCPSVFSPTAIVFANAIHLINSFNDQTQ